jgi:DnaJ-class molecular chaperone
MKDYYYILGIKREASIDEIKKAYRKLSLKLHPDINQGDEFFSDRFKEINEAHEILSDNIKRAKYDSGFSSSTQTGNTNTGYNFDPIIEYFKADKISFEYDEAITFSWKTINSDKVTIKPFGTVQPIGQKTYKIKDFKQSDIIFELIAENSNTGRQTKHSLKLKNKTYLELYGYFKTIIESDKKENSQKKENSKKREIPIGVYLTDKGEIEVELNFEHAIPSKNNKVYQNNLPAINGKYKLGFLDYIVVKNGIIIDITSF